MTRITEDHVAALEEAAQALHPGFKVVRIVTTGGERVEDGAVRRINGGEEVLISMHIYGSVRVHDEVPDSEVDAVFAREVAGVIPLLREVLEQ